MKTNMIKVLSFFFNMNVIKIEGFHEITRHIKDFVGNKYLTVFSHEKSDELIKM